MRPIIIPIAKSTGLTRYDSHDWRAWVQTPNHTIVGPPRQSKLQAEQDRINLTYRHQL